MIPNINQTARPPKSKPILPARKLIPKKSNQELVTLLCNAINDIYNKNSFNLSFEELYRSTYNLVIAKKGSLLYDQVIQQIQSCLLSKAHSIIGSSAILPSPLSLEACQIFLKNTSALWSLHSSSINMIQSFLMYLDKVYVKAEKKLSIIDMSLNLFKSSILYGPKFNLLPALIDTISFSINSERSGLKIDRLNLKTSVSITMDVYHLNGKNTMSLFDTNVKPEILSATRIYYKNQSSNYISQPGIVNFSKSSSRSELYEIFAESRIEDFRSVYCLFSYCPEHEKKIQDILYDHIVENVTKITLVDSSKESISPDVPKTKPLKPNPVLIASTYVESMFSLYTHYSDISNQQFVKTRKFQKAVNEAFVKVLGNNSMAAEQISLYVDDQIKRSFKGIDLSNLSVSVFSPNFYPLPGNPETPGDGSKTASVIYPDEATKLKNEFEKFYDKKFNGRKLTWLYNMGNCDINANFNNQKIELNVSTVIMVILMLFNNDGVKLRYEEINERIPIPKIDLDRNLQSIACAKYKLLIKTPKSITINPGDIFELNTEFENPTKKLKIPLIAAVTPVKKITGDKANPAGLGTETGLDESSLNRLEKSRMESIDAAIVRILKSRKTIVHSLLVSETVSQLQSRFIPTPVMIRHRIDELIDKGYIERSSEDRNTYHYIS
ncbi:Cullin-4A [Smittium mucronatum]|uniref:Cullin-4A n=1 Tax=Smittium mucronatum TaxID=133383 RepID=A0A1R0GRP2_9FUNG|nr:Cullin-4A [Smittium mucronatum]